MRTNNCIKPMLIAMVMMVAGNVMAQKDITLKVKNVPEGNGKVMVASSKGHAMVAEARNGIAEIKLKDVPGGVLDIYAFHDANGNNNLDMEGTIPQENCAVGQFDIKDETECIELTLENIPERIKNN